ncbi:DUF11 domain-containing protein [Microbispora sp. NBC_01189]|uniref:DUF7507 domain-containing protein n=1 Tax=Microbispora sp. NBC_01189 TaxID=2903583 RepID=UPI002E140865|nr:DUF11 domain-containing protein [Microbispora sp. NBC_01189]
MTCTGTYTVAQADIDAGAIVNRARARGTPPWGLGVYSDPSAATVDVLADPGLSLVKSADPAEVTWAGQEVTYSFAVANTGNVTVSDLAISDVEFSGTGRLSKVICPQTSLAPEESTTCTATYTVPQADVDAGSIVNTAVAAAVVPSGQIVGSNASTTTVRVNWEVPLTPRFTCPRNRWLGNIANYGFTVFNNTPVTTETSVTNDLSGILDDARFLGGKASDGALSNTSAALTWKGKLKPYQKALITYAVQLAKPSGDRKLASTLVGPAPAGEGPPPLPGGGPSP